MKNNRLKFRLNSKRPSNTIICVFFLSLFFVAIGFSYIRSSLAINGSTEIVKGAWNIHFDNIRNITSSGSTLEVKNAPTLNESKKVIDFSLKFNNDFEYYQFLVDIVNEGEISGTVGDISFYLGSLSGFLDYSITYEDGSAFNIGDTIVIGESKTIKVYIGINSDANLTLLPSDTNYQLSLEIPFVQEEYKKYNVDILGVKQMAYLDNKRSTYVSSNSGIDFHEASSNTNGKGLYLRADTENDEYPIYYYRGDIDNNHVLFGGFCWQIIRTTEKGGTKLLYEGIAENNKCPSTMTSLISLSGSNSFGYSESALSLADVGYMYGTKYDNDFWLTDTAYIYGADVTYADGVYTLVNPTETAVKAANSRTKHYTCKLTTNGTCSTVYYVTGINNIDTNIWFLSLTGGKRIEDIISESTTNTNDSYIKSKVDQWYVANLSSQTSQLEDAIWCNERSIASGGYLIDGDTKDSDIGESYFKGYYRVTNSSEIPKVKVTEVCINKNDRFTVSDTTNGNGALDYPIGLITSDEAILTGGFSTINTFISHNNEYYWTMTPYSTGGAYVSNVFIAGAGGGAGGRSNVARGIRPSIVLKVGTVATSGNGTRESPYIVS